MQKPPQIIVIPQSMLGVQPKSLLKLAPSIMPRMIASSPLLSSSSSPLLSSTVSSSTLLSSQSPLLSSSSSLLSPSPLHLSPSPLLSSSSLLSSRPRPVAAVVGSKRPAPSSSPSSNLLLDIKKEEDDDETGPVRKRANLDHLSPEERMMRRKLKNRVAAQTARDKKKAATDCMEKQLAELRAELEESLETTANLLETNTQLQLENAALQQQNSDLMSRLSSSSSPHQPLTLELLPLSPPSSPPISPSTPHTSLSTNTVMPPPETAAGAGQQLGVTSDPDLAPRVVVERLDSLGSGLDPDSVVCGNAGPDHQPLTGPLSTITSDHLTLALSASSLEEETYTPVGLDFNTNVSFDLCATLNTPNTEGTELLDSFLADAGIMTLAEEDKWAKSLDELFPDLD